MATIIEDIVVDGTPGETWDAVRDVGAVHIRLAPVFVTKAVYENGVRKITFGNGTEVFEPIVTLDEVRRRLVWTAQGGVTTHYNSSMQVVAEGRGARIIWTVDFLPDSATPRIAAAMKAGVVAIGAHLGRGSANALSSTRAPSS